MIINLYIYIYYYWVEVVVAVVIVLFVIDHYNFIIFREGGRESGRGGEGGRDWVTN